MILADITKLFYDIDDFCLQFIPQLERQLLASGEKQRLRSSQLAVSEVITIAVLFHLSATRTFKDFYQRHVRKQLRSEFPGLVSYSRFIALLGKTLPVLLAFLQTRFGDCSGISFIDSTSLAVCKPQRINWHKTFFGIAARGQTSMGWFYGFKLHIAVNDCGALLGAVLTPGNVSDSNWSVVSKVAKRLFGKLFGDKGYIGKPLAQKLYQQSIHMITKIRKNMKNVLMPLWDKLLLRKRAIVESVYDILKNCCQIEHSRHRSPINFLVHLLSGLVAYSYLPKRPSLNFDKRLLISS